LTEVARDLGLEEAKEAITARGRERGFVTSEDLLVADPRAQRDGDGADAGRPVVGDLPDRAERM
jgi:hypothetical protein